MGCRAVNYLLGVVLFCCCSYASANIDQLQSVLAQIEHLESKSDPKCYATASRLEDFMFGTPLSKDARFFKNLSQKKWLMSLWHNASLVARKNSHSRIEKEDVEQATSAIFDYKVDKRGHWLLHFKRGNKLKIHKDDKRQYSSIAYSLRALLAVQQESLFDPNSDLLPLSKTAITALTHGMDLFSLSVLKVADQQARQNNQHEISKASLNLTWTGLHGSSGSSVTVELKTAQNLSKPIELKLLKAIIGQKVRSYQSYNQISNPLFVRNLQVYFARNRWPKDENEAKVFRQLFTETLIAFAGDIYTGAQNIAANKGHALILESDVSQFIQLFIPHKINQYEDAVFFPNLNTTEQVTIESYDMDAFRDSGIHWRYLQYAVINSQFKAYLEADPFAAELLAENVAQFGVLLLRMIGNVGRDAGDKRILLTHFEQATTLLQSLIIKDAKMASEVTATKPIELKSSPTSVERPIEGLLFTNVTKASGVDVMHRSSDWLNRLLRSYLTTGKETATSVIPPAFGGAGVASQDINNDGFADLLILSGLGNHLYLNKGNGQFEDITKSAGLTWLRQSDKQPGEPRQPLIADLNNDGLQDIVITYVNDVHRVYKNLGNAKFVDVTNTSKLGGLDMVGGPATVFDYDNDGLLDIYITYFGDYIHGVLPTLKRRNDNGLPNKLFRNLGGFKFEDVTAGSNLDHTGWGQAVTHIDFDADSLQDLIVGNDFGVNAYFKNLGNGKFENVTKSLGTDKPSYTMGIGTADLNDDFIADIYISNIVTMNKDEKYVMPGEATTMKFNPDNLSTMRVVEANDLFISTKKADKSIHYDPSQTVGRGYSSTGWSWDADFFDYDNDGDDDLYVLNGMNEFNLYSSENSYYTEPLEDKPVDVYIPVATKESNVFFSNKGGKLNNISKQSGVDLVGNSRSAAYFDIEGDGDLDIVVNNYHEKAVIYRNNSERLGNNWLKIKLIGAPNHGVNLDAIGAQIIVSTSEHEHVWRTIQGSTGYMSVHPKQQHFGLKKHQQADISIKWPNGKQSRLADVKANQILIIDYNKQKFTRVIH